MTSLANHQSNDFTKLLLSGDSGSGKTGALASLAKTYSLRILDMDNGLDSLKSYILKECPERINSVEFRTLRDDYTSSPTGPKVAKPKAFVEALKMLDNWKYDDVDLGDPAGWGSDCILVIDSLTFFADAAFNWAVGLNPTAKDPRQWYGSAQSAVEDTLALLTSGSFKTNVIVTSHFRYMENLDGSKKAYPTAVGSALGPTIPRYFNNWAQVENKNGKRQIQVGATPMIDLKNTKPFEAIKPYPIDNGLAEFFGVLRKAPEKPKSVTLVKRA